LGYSKTTSHDLVKMVVEATVIGKDEHGRKIYEVEKEESKPDRAAI